MLVPNKLVYRIPVNYVSKFFINKLVYYIFYPLNVLFLSISSPLKLYLSKYSPSQSVPLSKFQCLPFSISFYRYLSSPYFSPHFSIPPSHTSIFLLLMIFPSSSFFLWNCFPSQCASLLMFFSSNILFIQRPPLSISSPFNLLRS